MSIFLDQADFMLKGGQTVEGISPGQIALYANLIAEESGEFAEALGSAMFLDAENIKEAVDVIVVAAGFLISALGAAGALEAWNAVHESNLAKVSGPVEKREDGKILKNEVYKSQIKAELMKELDRLVNRAALS